MSDTQTSRGMQLIAAYRAARLGQPANPLSPAATASNFARPGPVASAAETPGGITATGGVRPDAPLAAIGFGPGMQIRLSQIGVRTAADLAEANAADLRTALGDISRLVDVEAWIASARQAVCFQAA